MDWRYFALKIINYDTSFFHFINNENNGERDQWESVWWEVSKHCCRIVEDISNFDLSYLIMHQRFWGTFLYNLKTGFLEKFVYNYNYYYVDFQKERQSLFIYDRMKVNIF